MDDSEPTPPTDRRLFRRGIAILMTLATGLFAAGLTAAGLSAINSLAATVEVDSTAEIVAVRTQPLSISDHYSVARTFVGQVEPTRVTEMGFEPAGVVERVLVEEGDRVAAGQPLARLDTRSLESRRQSQRAARAALAAQAELARLTAERQSRLKEQGFATHQGHDEARLRLAEIQARIDEVDAAIAGIGIELGKSTIRAPFSGRIGARLVDEGATVSPGMAVVEILEDGPPLMRVGLSERFAGTAQPGMVVDVSIGVQTYSAVLKALRADLDPQTRTLTALFALTDPAARDAALYGQTGTVRLDNRLKARGAWVPVSALRQGVEGLWTILTIEEDDGTARAAHEAVEVLYADESRAFVRGTFDEATQMIAAGGHRVTSGQKVRVLDGRAPAPQLDP